MLEAMKLGLTSYHRAEASRSIGNIHLAFLSMVHSRKNAITHPMTAIAITPASKLINATACLPIPLLHKVGSSTKSPASISTHAAYISIPADMADMMPSINFSRTVYRHRKNDRQGQFRVQLQSLESSKQNPPSSLLDPTPNEASPIKIPTGVVTANKDARIGLRRDI